MMTPADRASLAASISAVMKANGFKPEALERIALVAVDGSYDLVADIAVREVRQYSFIADVTLPGNVLVEDLWVVWP